MRHNMDNKKRPAQEKQQELRCHVCGRWSKNCRSEHDGLGNVIYCVCSRCLIERGDADEVMLARASMRRN